MRSRLIGSWRDPRKCGPWRSAGSSFTASRRPRSLMAALSWPAISEPPDFMPHQKRKVAMPLAPQSRSCVIVVENLPVPFDRRVWQEAQALNRAGWRVSVICPSNAAFPAKFEIIDDIAIYRHSLPPEGRGAAAYFREYAAALFHEFRLLVRVHRDRGFSIMPACNPPGLIFLAAAPVRLLGN